MPCLITMLILIIVISTIFPYVFAYVFKYVIHFHLFNKYLKIDSDWWRELLSFRDGENSKKFNQFKMIYQLIQQIQLQKVEVFVSDGYKSLDFCSECEAMFINVHDKYTCC